MATLMQLANGRLQPINLQQHEFRSGARVNAGE
jgi:hypothetical protein